MAETPAATPPVGGDGGVALTGTLVNGASTIAQGTAKLVAAATPSPPPKIEGTAGETGQANIVQITQASLEKEDKNSGLA